MAGMEQDVAYLGRGNSAGSKVSNSDSVPTLFTENHICVLGYVGEWSAEKIVKDTELQGQKIPALGIEQ